MAVVNENAASTAKRQKVAAPAAAQDSDQEQLEEDAGAVMDDVAGTADAAEAATGPLGLPLIDEVIPRVKTNDPFEEANLIRKALKIKVAGSDVPAPLRSFADLYVR